MTAGVGAVRRAFWRRIPRASLVRGKRFQHYFASTFLADGSREAVHYAALVATVSAGGSPFRSAILGAAALVPPTVLGFVGGMVADSFSRRIALSLVYFLQAVGCIAVPLFLGTGFVPVVMLIFTLNVLGQVSGPAEQALAPVVACGSQIPQANSLFGLSSNAGTLVGTAVLAPVLVITLGLEAVFIIAGLALLLAAQRAFTASGPARDSEPTKRQGLRCETEVRHWLSREPAVASMVGLVVIAGVANVILQVLAPQYVVDVIGVSAESAVYVFAPSTFGIVLALVAAPFLIRVLGERRCALAALLLTVSTLVALGFVRDSLAGYVDPVNPLRGLALVGIGLGAKLRTAGLLAFPLGFGVSLTTTAVQTYINRRVPEEIQGRVFAVQSTLKNGAAIIPLLMLGGMASMVGVAVVLVVSPFVLLAVAVVLLLLSRRVSTGLPETPREFVSSLLEQEPSELSPDRSEKRLPLAPEDG